MKVLKKRFLGILIITSMLVLMTPSFEASALNDNVNSQQLGIKKFYGTISEIEKALSEQTDKETKQLYNSQLKVSELEDYQEIVKVKVDAPVIKDIIEEFPDTFSGMYYQPERGTIVVQITKDSVESRDKIYRSITHKEKIEFQITKYSKKELDNAQNIIRENSPEGIIKALIPDVENNKLIVSLSELTDENKRIIESLVEKSDFIEFISPINLDLQVVDETNYGDPFPFGARISRYFSEGGTNYQGSCTVGYFGVNQSDKDVLVTAGHCDDVGSTLAWFQPNNSTPKIGNWAFRTSSSLTNGTDKTSDAGYITLTGRDGMPYVPYPSSSDMTPITGIYLDDLANDTVYLRGSTTGALVSGKIKYSGVDVWMGHEGYGYLRSMVLASYSSQGGDSGGSVVTDYAWDNAKQTYTFDLAGTHTGRLTISDHDDIEDGNYAVYNPIWTTYTDLDLAGLYLVQ